MNNLPFSTLTDLLSEKIKRDQDEEYNQFVNSLNELAAGCKTIEELRKQTEPLEKFLPHLDLMLSITHDYDDIMNMKATLLDLLVNDLEYKSIFLLVYALSTSRSLSNLQDFIAPIEHWVAVIKSKEMLEAV